MNRGVRASGMLFALLVGFCPTTRGAPAVEPARGEAAERVGTLVKDIEGKDYQKKRDAIRSLAKMVEKNAGKDMSVFAPAVEPLMSMVGWGGPGRKVSRLAARTIAEIGEPAVPTLLANLKSPKARRRWMAAEILITIGPEKAPVPKAILPLIEDKDPYVRRICFASLGKLGNAAASVVPRLEKAAEDPEPFAAITAYRSLVLITGKGEPYVRRLADFLKHTSKDARAFAASTLGGCGRLARPMWPALVEALKDVHPQVRVNAAAALGKIGADEELVIDALIERVKSDKSKLVRSTAAHSLEKLKSRRAKE